jgi:hypothetical protein
MWKQEALDEVIYAGVAVAVAIAADFTGSRPGGQSGGVVYFSQHFFEQDADGPVAFVRIEGDQNVAGQGAGRNPGDEFFPGEPQLEELLQWLTPVKPFHPIPGPASYSLVDRFNHFTLLKKPWI